ncbi:MAG: cob(I)yrinic acid a,c-diamide adenosyltransferase [Planctomycetota bacterium]
MKIYTRTGDTGTTGLFGGPRVAKDDNRIEAYGTVDELNASLGLVRSCIARDQVTRIHGDDDRVAGLDRLDDHLQQVQHELFSIGAELASPDPDEFNLRVISQQHIGRVETWIDEAESDLAPLTQFILPGGSLTASNLHLARAICRRAERRVISLSDDVEREAPISSEIIMYLNRLSDYLFVASRWSNWMVHMDDEPWVHPETP